MARQTGVNRRMNWRTAASLVLSLAALALLVVFILVGEFWMIGSAGVLCLLAVAASLSLREAGESRESWDRVVERISLGVGGLVMLGVLLLMALSFFSD